MNDAKTAEDQAGFSMKLRSDRAALCGKALCVYFL